MANDTGQIGWTVATETEERHPIYGKDPDSPAKYGVNWDGWLATGETVSTISVITPAGITSASENISGLKTFSTLSGGTAGTTYSVTHRITTSGGEGFDQTIAIQVWER